MAAFTTPAQVCNVALLDVGQRQIIDDLEEGTPQAEACNALFGPLRNELLAKAAWKFALRRAVLVDSGETRDEWGMAYEWPSDCLRPVRIVNLNQQPSNDDIVFDVELNDTGNRRLILTDLTPATLIYVAEIRNVGLWDDLFCKAVAAELAVRLARALPVKPALGRDLAGDARNALLEALAYNDNVVVKPRRADAEWIADRS